jgi:FixJ family two-component response regulator
VFLVDDEPAIRKALARLLRTGGWPVEAFGSCEEFLHGHDPHAPGCLVLDMMLPGLNGEELQRLLADNGSPLPIIFITGQGDIPMCARAIKAGAVEFLTKPVDADELFRAVDEAFNRDRENRRERDDVAAIKQRLAMLTPREREVLAHVVAGKTNKIIAADLGAVEKTIKVHRGRVMEKMGANSLAELVRLAAQVGIGTPGPLD